MRVQYGVLLLREGQVQSVRARLDRLCSGRDLNFKGVQRACTIIQFEREENIRVFCECRAESVDRARVPTGIVQCSRGGRKIRINSQAHIEVRGGVRPGNRA